MCPPPGNDLERMLGLIDEYAPLADVPAGPQTMLIIDDDVINRTVLAAIFSEHYRIEEADDGDVGLDLILADPARYCSVLLDYQMRRMNGLEVLRRLDERGLMLRIPVFLISAEADAEVTRAAYELGVMDVIEKPVIPHVVQRRVGSVVELFAARRRLSGVVERQQDELLRRAAQIIELNQRPLRRRSSSGTESRAGTCGASTTSRASCSRRPRWEAASPPATWRASRLPPSCTTSGRSPYRTRFSESRASSPRTSSRS